MKITNRKEHLTKQLHIIMFIGATLLVLLLSLKPVASLGVAPSFYTIDDVSKDVVELKLRILNNQQKDLFLQLDTSGDLSEMVEFETDVIRLSPSEKEKEITYTLYLSENLEPGINTLDVIVRQIEDVSTKETQTSVGATVTVVQKVQVFVPYPQMHLSGQLFVTSESISAPIVFTSHIVNRGSVDASVQGFIRIKGPLQNVIDDVVIQPTLIGSSQQKKIETTYLGITQPGVYIAESILQYGDQTLVLRKDFMVGQKEVVVRNLEVSEFTLGDIVALKIDAQNTWNMAFENVYAELVVMSKEGAVVQRFKSSPETLQAYESKSLIAFWETDRLTVGDYTLVVIMYFDKGTAQNEFPVGIYMDKVVFTDFITGNVIKQEGSISSSDFESNRLTFFGILLVIILITNVAILFYFKNMKKK